MNNEALEALESALKRARKVSKNLDSLRFSKPNAFTGGLHADCWNGLQAVMTDINSAMQAVTRGNVDGHVLVPIDPTEAMKQAVSEHMYDMDNGIAVDIYRAMIKAARGSR